MKFILLMMSLVFTTCSFAKENYLPSSCKPVTVEGEALMLSVKKPGLMMIHNLSDMDLWITHPVSDPSASAGWSSRLQAKHWAALALDKESFELSCIESKPGHEQQVPCKGVISVCRWFGVAVPPQADNTYWVAENMTLPALLNHLGGRGFKLPA